jgi:hypothetical protein
MTVLSAPSCSLALTVAALPTCTVTVSLMPLNPFAETWTLYWPGSKGPELKAPEPPAVRLMVRSVPVLVTTTLASLTNGAHGIAYGTVNGTCAERGLSQHQRRQQEKFGRQR